MPEYEHRAYPSRTKWSQKSVGREKRDLPQFPSLLPPHKNMEQQETQNLIRIALENKED